MCWKYYVLEMPMTCKKGQQCLWCMIVEKSTSECVCSVSFWYWGLTLTDRPQFETKDAAEWRTLLHVFRASSQQDCRSLYCCKWSGCSTSAALSQRWFCCKDVYDANKHLHRPDIKERQQQKCHIRCFSVQLILDVLH